MSDSKNEKNEPLNIPILMAVYMLQARELQLQGIYDCADICSIVNRVNQLTTELIIEGKITEELEEKVKSLQEHTKANKELLQYFQKLPVFTKYEHDELEEVKWRIAILAYQRDALLLHSKACLKRVVAYDGMLKSLEEEARTIVQHCYIANSQIIRFRTCVDKLKDIKSRIKSIFA